MALSAAEQYEIELINRARLDPLAEARRYGIDLNAGLAAGTISTAAKQVLAPNDLLADAAQRHSEWMLATSTFSHTGLRGSNPGERMKAAGYVFSGTWNWGENLAWSGTTGPINLETAIADNHRGLYESPHHRVATFSANYREVGVGQVGGKFIYNGTAYNSSLLTQNFANSGSGVFVTGVAYRDADANAFYGIREGLGGLRISSGAAADTTEAAGGYGYKVVAGAGVLVTVAQGSTTLATLSLDLTAGNGKLDIVQGAAGGWSLALSASARLITGITDASLLGVANLALTGNDLANRLTGNAGHNLLSGAGGNDVLTGGAGNDTLLGGAGNDVLTGGAGIDVMNGGLGHDQYVFDTLGDRIEGELATSLGGGNDALNAWITTTLPLNVEVLRLQGTAAINGTGGLLAETLVGNAGNNILSGEGGNDTLNGGLGNDRIIGGQGADALTGALGNDVFVFRTPTDSGRAATSRDVITDFVRGQDKIDLAALDANLRVTGDQAFAFIGAAAFTPLGATAVAATAFGQVRQTISVATNSSLIEIDLNRDGIADMHIQLTGTTALSASDFLL